jgi:hypothetical protein
MRRRTSNSVLVFAAWLLAPVAARAEAPLVQVSLSCRPEAAPGRVLCELTYVAAAGARLSWVDALVTAAPSFVRPLRSRVTPERFGESTGAERKLSLAFVASSAGVGRVTVKARSVVCRGPQERSECRPRSHDVVAEIRVGS